MKVFVLGSKGVIDHGSLTVEDLPERRDESVEYLKQDIYLLGGVMLKAH